MHITGKQCRELLRGKQNQAVRYVPAFTYQALQKNTIVIPPKKINIYAKKLVKQSLFSKYFKRGDIPVVAAMKVISSKKKSSEFPLEWFCDPKDLDYCYYLPIFVDGVSDSDPNMRKLATNGAMDMILKSPEKVLPVLPKLILPLKRAFNTRDKNIIVNALKVIQMMVQVGPCVGQALVPYYRQLLAVCNLYKNINVHLCSGIDSQREFRVADVIEDTLKLLENCGGPNAFINIKYMIPTYESAIQPKCEMNRPPPPAVAPQQTQPEVMKQLSKEQ